jgi:hypothetical protein
VREYSGKDGSARIAVEEDASAVGHDLSRGVAHFSRTRRAAGETAAESAEAVRAGGNGYAAVLASEDGTVTAESAAGLESGPDESADEPGLAGSGADGPDAAGDGVLDEQAVAEFASDLAGSLGGVTA